MGYGFVEYQKRSDALKAIKKLQVSVVTCGWLRGGGRNGLR